MQQEAPYSPEGGVLFASQSIFAPEATEMEDIYPDEIEDGLCASALEQAKIWVDEAKNNSDSPVDSNFLLKLLAMPQILKGNLTPELYNSWSHAAKRRQRLDHSVQARMDLELGKTSERRARLRSIAENAARMIAMRRLALNTLLTQLAAEKNAESAEKNAESATPATAVAPAIPSIPKVAPLPVPSTSSKGKEPAVSEDEKGKEKEKEEAPQGIPNVVTDSNAVCYCLGEIMMLSKGVQNMTGDAILCQKCSGALNKSSTLTQPLVGALNCSEDRQLWQCEFCGEQNLIRVDREEVPATLDCDYLVESGLEGTTSQLIIFCIDISGSMCVTTEVNSDQVKLPDALTRLLARERAELAQFIEGGASQYMPQQIQKLATEDPKTRVALITFNSDVTIYGDGSVEPQVVTGDMLNQLESLQSKGLAYEHFQTPVYESQKRLADRIYAMEPNGATALGPALVMAVAMASRAKQAKIVVCTDGLANVGLGNVYNIPVGRRTPEQEQLAQNAEQFYRGVAKNAAASGVSISVIGIRGDDCSMENLGLLADLTQGNVNIVNPLDLEKNFLSILSRPLLLRNVNCTAVIDSHFAIRGLNESVLQREIGNLYADTDLTFGFSMREKLSTPLPPSAAFQLQVNYTRLDGTKWLRILTRVLPVTASREKAEANVNAAVVALNAVRHSAHMAHSADYQAARINLISAQRMMQRVMRSAENQRDYLRFIVQGERLDAFMRIAQQQEDVLGVGADSSARRAARDDSAANAIFNMKSISHTTFKSVVAA